MNNSYLKYSSMAFQMGATIGLFAYMGYRLDRHFHTAQSWFTIVFSLAGVGISLYSVMRDFIKPGK